MADMKYITAIGALLCLLVCCFGRQKCQATAPTINRYTITMTSPLPDSYTAIDITLGELLEAPATVDCTIRYVCAVRKALHECEVLTNDEADLELEINRLFHRIGRARRDKAFETSTARHKEATEAAQQRH